ncbi:MAG TPA: hypothetical protein VHM02_14915, partial [Thermoanaerobaculia bacterium]|nr:hypothetical protein [Thermoanaerobaculia bacterium]
MKTRIALVVLAVLAVPCAAWAEATAPAAPEPAVAAPAAAEAAPDAPVDANPAPAVEQPVEPLFLADGCSAEQFCIHTPPATVSC